MTVVIKRRAKLCCLDFEQYAGPLFFIYDSITLGLYVAGVYILLIRTPPPHDKLVYATVGAWFFLLFNGSRAIFRVFECYLVSDVMLNSSGRCDCRRLMSFAFFVFTGIRPARGPIGLIETLLDVSLFSAFLSVFVASSLYFFIEVVFYRAHDIWFNTLTQYPKRITEAPCLIVDILEEIAPIFFSVTNHIVVADVLIALNGLYFQVLGWRYRIRSFYQLVWPKITQMCDGGSQEIRFDESVIAMTSAIIFGYVLALTPLALFRDGRRLFSGVWVWLIALLAITACFTALFFLNDAGIMFFALVIPDSTWTRKSTQLAYDGFGSLAIMGISCICLAATSRSALAVQPPTPEDQTPFERFMKSISNVLQLIATVLLSEGAFVMMVAFGLSMLTGELGIPLHDVSFEKITGTEPWPTYMHLNEFEIELTDIRSENTLEYMFGNLITNMTKTNFEFLKDACKFVADAVLGWVDDIPFVNIDTSGATNAVCSGVDPIKDLVIESEYVALHFLLKAIRFVAGNALDLLNEYITKVLNMLKFDLGIEDILNTIESILRLVPRLLPYIPAIFVAIMMIFSLISGLIPTVAFGLQLMLIAFATQLVIYSAAFVLSIRLVLLQFNYTTVVDVDYNVLALDIVVSVLAVAGCFMLIDTETFGLALDPVNQKLIRDFEEDNRAKINTQRRKIGTQGEMVTLVRVNRSSKRTGQLRTKI